MVINISTDIHIFIISWEGQHENATFIANQLNDINDQVSIIYSDPDPEYSLEARCRLIKRSNELFWGDKFKACLDNCESENLLIIHADCKYNDWFNVVDKYDKAIKEISNLGVWSPVINFTFFVPELISLFKIDNTDYEIVCYIDGIVFGFSKTIQNRMNLASYQHNKFGWWIDRMIACFALSMNKLLIIDKSIQIKHPENRGYEESDARKQGVFFFNEQFSDSEKVYDKLIQSYIDLNILKKSKKSIKLPVINWVLRFFSTVMR
jgi:hypothetical protein